MQNYTWKCSACGAVNAESKTHCCKCGKTRSSILKITGRYPAGQYGTQMNSQTSEYTFTSTTKSKPQINYGRWIALAAFIAAALLMAFSGNKNIKKEDTPADTELPVISSTAQNTLPTASIGREEQLLSQGKRVVASIPQENLYICVSSDFESMTSHSLFLICGDRSTEYYYDVLIKYIEPDIYSTIGEMYLFDLDNDGEEEIVCILPNGSGTGMYLDELIVFDPDGNGGYVDHALTPEEVSAKMEPLCKASRVDDENTIVQFITDNGQTFQRVHPYEPSLCLGLSFLITDEEIKMSMYASFVEVNNGIYKFSCDITDFYDAQYNWIATGWMSTGNAFSCSVNYTDGDFIINSLSLNGEPYNA